MVGRESEGKRVTHCTQKSRSLKSPPRPQSHTGGQWEPIAAYEKEGFHFLLGETLFFKIKINVEHPVKYHRESTSFL